MTRAEYHPNGLLDSGRIEGSGRAMPGVEAQRGGHPCADDVRAALEHIAISEAFRGSPQLVSFLRYVVESTLRGASDRIKGYTIAVEALGRGENFDPQADPIVRVEAMRLRRALGRYYANGGRCDLVLIELPLGSYVPAFHRNTLDAPPADRAETPVTPSTALLAPPRRGRAFAAAALVIAGAAIYAGLDFWFDFN